MTSPQSHRKKVKVFWLLVMLGFAVLWLFTDHLIKTKRQRAITALMSIHSQEVRSFKIHPEATYTDDYRDAIEFKQEEQLVMAFFQAIRDSQPYQPEHDRALAQWGMQIIANSTTVRIGCYIPDLKPDIIVGHIRTAFGSGDFQSRSLLRWYQKYGHYWKVGHYQNEQYSRVKPILTSISPKDITSFRIIPDVSETSMGKETNEFSQDAELVTTFFQALEDMQFAAPKYKEVIDQWGIQIHTGTTTLSIACSIPAEKPTGVIGLIDSSAGYSYFQSRKLLQWYQKYKHRWLSPPTEGDRERGRGGEGEQWAVGSGQ